MTQSHPMSDSDVIANFIKNYSKSDVYIGEFKTQNKTARENNEINYKAEGRMIKDFCVKLKINRLGQLKYIGFND